MHRVFVVFLAILSASSAFANPADEVRATEVAFAQAFADRDATKFFSFVSEDANFLSGTSVLSGRQKVIDGWGKLLTSEKPPFSWHPERVVTNAAGDIGLSTGPVFNAKGEHIGDFASIWQRQKDGSWKILFDGPGAPACPAAEKK